MSRPRAVALAAVGLAVLGCKSPLGNREKQQEVVPIQVIVTPSSASLTVGQQVTLAATVTGTTSNYNVTWSSSNTAVATVSGGTVTGVGQGVTVVSAASVADPTKFGTSAIAVSAAGVASVSITPSAASLQAGTTQQLQAVVKDGAGNTMTGKTVTWSSSDTTTARVSSTGLLTGTGVGQATITASADGKSGTATATVTLALPLVSLDTAWAIGPDSARLSGSVEGWKAPYDIRFQASRNASFSPADSSLWGSETTSYWWWWTYLNRSGGTSYYFRLQARNAAGTAASAAKSFTTRAAAAPRQVTAGSDSLGPGNIRFTWTGSANGADTWLSYQHGSTATSLAPIQGCDSVGEGYLSRISSWCRVAGYRGSTTYWWRVVATNSAGTTSSGVGTFTTLPPTLPSLTTLPADSVTATRAIIWGYIVPNGADATVYFDLGTTPDNTMPLSGCTVNIGLLPKYQGCIISNLQPNTTYYYIVVASNSVGTNSEKTLSFTTPRLTGNVVTTSAPAAGTPAQSRGATSAAAGAAAPQGQASRPLAPPRRPTPGHR